MSTHPSHPADERLRDLDALPADVRASVLEHVRTCRACRAIVIAERPEALFGLLVQRPIPTEALDRLSARVSAAIDAEDVRTGTDSKPVPGRRYAVAAIAASLLLAFVIGWPLMRDDAGTQVAEVTAPPAPVIEDVVEPAVALPVRGVELLSSPGEAEVVDFAIGDAHVVMIFDKEFDI